MYARGCLPSRSPGRTGPKEQEPVWGRAEKAGRRRTGRMGRGEHFIETYRASFQTLTFFMSIVQNVGTGKDGGGGELI